MLLPQPCFSRLSQCVSCWCQAGMTACCPARCAWWDAAQCSAPGLRPCARGSAPHPESRRTAAPCCPHAAATCSIQRCRPLADSLQTNRLECHFSEKPTQTWLQGPALACKLDELIRANVNSYHMHFVNCNTMPCSSWRCRSHCLSSSLEADFLIEFRVWGQCSPSPLDVQGIVLRGVEIYCQPLLPSVHQQMLTLLAAFPTPSMTLNCNP